MAAPFPYRRRQVHAQLAIVVAFATLAGIAAHAQVVFPTTPVRIHDVEWAAGTHHYAVSPPIHSPGDPEEPTLISGTADAEFVSGAEVHLTDGFHAGGFTGAGRFRARIGDQFGDPESMVLIPSDPGARIEEGVVHVPKWEKLEIGIELPQAYQDAIASFFANYYSNGPNAPATPGNTSTAYDLNPYADDSLQLVMTLTEPSGQQTLKWGFFMREAQWDGPEEWAILTYDETNVLAPYKVRFRIAPDQEGPWSFSISIKAPHTSAPDDTPLPPCSYSDLSFICGPPLEDNHGYLRVHPVNKRILQFEDGRSFMGLGTNLADIRGGPRGLDVPEHVNRSSFFRIRQDLMEDAFEQLHDVGGNFARMFLLRQNFAPEWVNTGVYDHYYSPDPCTGLPSAGAYTGNGQFHSWSFDRIVNEARKNGIYIQLCIDPYPPVTAFEKLIWGNHPYVDRFMEPGRDPATGMYDMKEFFYTDGDPANTGSGIFYYWKRKYKYIMARWGYSVNIAAIEPFNEIDQMFTYQDNDLTGNEAFCPDNQLNWLRDEDLPATIDQWVTDISDYVRGDVEPSDPAHSPLGEDKKLFLMGYTNVSTAADVDHYLPFTNPKVDLMSVHNYAWSDYRYDTGHPDSWMKHAFDNAQDFWHAYPTPNAPLSERKPFTQGEMNYWNEMEVGNWKRHIEEIFHNYDVSFHNEIWSSAFSGKFAAGTSWIWHRVFWWPNALKVPPEDDNNDFQPNNEFSNVLGDTNFLNVGGIRISIMNRRIHHHFKPLADLLAHPSWQVYDFFNGDYAAELVFDSDTSDGLNALEAYYLKDTTNSVAIGWVHNRNAWVMNNYYLNSSRHNFLGCTPPDSTTITLRGFATNTPLFITWFPTRLNSTVHPPHDTLITTTGDLQLDLSGYLGGTANNYLDTLRSDYAFIITPGFFQKRMPPRPMVEQANVEPGWDFELYPNPASDILFLQFTDDQPKRLSVSDVAGRQVITQANVTATTHHLVIGNLAMGSYWVQISDGEHRKVKKLIIH